ncbi:MAG: hypothetical protein QOJ35_570 [Solirubrobacteraceae bacterium]|nr:hypothetical protein [Solirubrobacteraceae bacterium]
MSDADALARIDAHMQRGNELLALIDEHLQRGISDTSSEHLAHGAEFEARIEEHIARANEIIAAEGRSYDEWRYSMRQDSLRNERVLSEMSSSLRRMGETSDRLADELTRRTDDIIAEGRAQRAALFRMLDRLGGGDGPAPAAG